MFYSPRRGVRVNLTWATTDSEAPTELRPRITHERRIWSETAAGNVPEAFWCTIMFTNIPWMQHNSELHLDNLLRVWGLYKLDDQYDLISCESVSSLGFHWLINCFVYKISENSEIRHMTWSSSLQSDMRQKQKILPLDWKQCLMFQLLKNFKVIIIHIRRLIGN